GTNREVGIMTDVEAQEALLAANLEQAQQLRALLPDLERMARLPGAMGEAARAMLVDLNNQIKVLENTTTLFEATLKNGVSEGLNKAISGLVDGTMSLREAIHELANTIFKSLLDMYAKNLTQYLMGPEGLGGLMGGFMDAANQGANGAGGLLAALFGNGVGAAGGAATAVADTAKLAQEQAVIAQEMAAAATLTTAGTTLSVSGTALSAAASALSAAAATMSASSGSSALGSAASAIGGMVMASSGGYTGPGGKFEPAGIVHRGEFVTRKAVTEQPGALAFLSDFNRVGMRAVEAWRKRYRARGFAEGGYVPAAPSVSSPLRALAASWNPVSATAGNTSVDNRIALNLFDDPARIAEVIRSPAGEKAFTVLLSRNPQKFRQLLGV
ncbi:MAG: hypothetical protein LBF93_10720, partial [Zoogloeaceae bacterium]|nr:hypothetical protein [Zoogloeaceae bacterium]